MNFLEFEGAVDAGANALLLGDHQVPIPLSREAAEGKLSLGVRPEHVRFADHSGYRGEVIATEYLGTTQIVTIETPRGTIKARAPSSNLVTPGELLGLEFDARTLTVFRGDSGRALLSAANEGVLNHG
jgi:multiple sugar transport system ATP-binding protein